MVIDPVNFLHSLAKAAVVSAAAMTPAVAIIYQPTGDQQANLWRNRAAEGAGCGDPYGIITPTGGAGDPTNPAAKMMVQAAVFGSNNDAAISFAQALFESLCLDSGGQEKRTVAPIAGYKAAGDSADGQWMIVSVDVLNRPAMLARDERGRAKIVSNFEIGFYKFS